MQGDMDAMLHSNYDSTFDLDAKTLGMRMWGGSGPRFKRGTRPTKRSWLMIGWSGKILRQVG